MRPWPGIEVPDFGIAYATGEKNHGISFLRNLREEGSDSDAGTPPEDPGGSHDNEAQPENRKAAAS